MIRNSQTVHIGLDESKYKMNKLINGIFGTNKKTREKTTVVADEGGERRRVSISKSGRFREKKQRLALSEASAAESTIPVTDECLPSEADENQSVKKEEKVQKDPDDFTIAAKSLHDLELRLYQEQNQELTHF